MCQDKPTPNQWPHPDDAALFALLELVAVRVALLHNLPLKVFTHKHNTLDSGVTGVCYAPKGEIEIVVRYRYHKRGDGYDVDGWHYERRTLIDILGTVGCKLAELREAEALSKPIAESSQAVREFVGTVVLDVARTYRELYASTPHPDELKG